MWQVYESKCFRKITPNDIANIFNQTYIKTAKIENAVSGFETTGNFPVNPIKFKEDDFISPDDVQFVVIHEPDEDKNLKPANTSELPDRPNIMDEVPSIINSQKIMNFIWIKLMK